MEVVREVVLFVWMKKKKSRIGAEMNERMEANANGVWIELSLMVDPNACLTTKEWMIRMNWLRIKVEWMR